VTGGDAVDAALEPVADEPDDDADVAVGVVLWSPPHDATTSARAIPTSHRRHSTLRR
jgi:hypothetical protein